MTSLRRRGKLGRKRTDTAFEMMIHRMAVRVFSLNRRFDELLDIMPMKHLVDESPRAGKLWHVVHPTLGGRAYFLEYKCPSTGKRYVSPIQPFQVEAYITLDPASGKVMSRFEEKGCLAEIAMAWKLGLTINEYINISAEA